MAFGLMVLSISKYKIPGVLETILVTLADGNRSLSLLTCVKHKGNQKLVYPAPTLEAGGNEAR